MKCENEYYTSYREFSMKTTNKISQMEFFLYSIVSKPVIIAVAHSI